MFNPEIAGAFWRQDLWVKCASGFPAYSPWW
ncbi:hypothetical protein HMPREF0290_1118 [Corynebacterium efficiens YS-314]|nr:hypothetical protein HMPREF0290_1118 [Corynebacterium efficiens YS-314]